MESAYGLAIIIDMLMTSLLLGYLLFINYKNRTTIIILAFTLIMILKQPFSSQILIK